MRFCVSNSIEDRRIKLLCSLVALVPYRAKHIRRLKKISIPVGFRFLNCETWRNLCILWSFSIDSWGTWKKRGKKRGEKKGGWVGVGWEGKKRGSNRIVLLLVRHGEALTGFWETVSTQPPDWGGPGVFTSWPRANFADLCRRCHRLVHWTFLSAHLSYSSFPGLGHQRRISLNSLSVFEWG